MTRPVHYATPEDAEQAFYDALAKGDVEALMAVWSEDDDSLCVHPTGVQIVGLNLIRESWSSIFANTRLRVQVEQIAHWQGMLLVIHHLTETLFVGDDLTPHGPLHVTHVYARGAHGWRLVSRHASAAGETPSLSEGHTRILH